MAVNLELRAELPEDAIVFDNMSYDGSIVGVTTDWIYPKKSSYVFMQMRLRKLQRNYKK